MKDDEAKGCAIIIAVLLAIGFISGTVIPAVREHFVAVMLVAFGVLVAVGVFIAILYATEQENEKQRKKQLVIDAKKALSLAKQQIFKDCLVIDSNIWMDERYDNFFKFLTEAASRHKYTVGLFGPQFDEMCNIKRTKFFRSQKNKRARLAIARIESLQKANLMRITPINIDADPSAYADPLIVKLLIGAARKKQSICFVSNDKELRIRVRQILQDSKSNSVKILEMEEITPLSDSFVEASEEKLI